ncbi:PTS system glucitol/sorbitol-specific EIIA component [Paraliobacillus ryukyuensis]|uniref:PTS system glucitol/sorbitol-specific IIA component n=1 Tax=Paraliobacillus ryukyuensis TaxID=200904 RepID=A0A366EGU3_9BACI|nr:PTS glucitol/sorbitol transporter subunit IIA [Paraliobacillus ryukyuensis]RBP00649.1 PTS system glucitol/sorbitol-specific IIA component [Paraliobacillus ryukyuensis]
MYKSTVKEIGPLVESFKEENLVILFGPAAPNELREVSVIHEQSETSDVPIQEGGQFQVDDQTYTVRSVGSQANANLKDLGHISIYFSEPDEGLLPGAVLIESGSVPSFKEGSVITFN